LQEAVHHTTLRRFNTVSKYNHLSKTHFPLKLNR
jgi:hypothetical protein